MNLPKLTTPIYQVILPSNGQTIRIRPFVVKEEKLLLMAAQSNDVNEIIDTTLQVVDNCLVDNDIKGGAKSLPFFDIDYLFIAMRAKSIGEVINMNFTCNNIVTNDTITPPVSQKCNAVMPVELNISKPHIIKKEMQDKIWITPEVGIKMTYPNYSSMKKLMSLEDDLTRRMQAYMISIDYLFDKDKVYPITEISKEELTDFFDRMTKEQTNKLDEWVENFPSFEIHKEQVCPKCGFNHTIKYKDFTSFF